MRFPHLGQQIFQILDNQDLNKCLEVSRYFKTFIEDQKFFWIRRIVQMTNIDIPLSRSESSSLEDLLKKTNRKDIQEIHTVAKSKQQKNWHSNVFHFAFLSGQTEILKKLFNSSRLATGIKKVMKQILLYHAVERGHIEIVQFIVQTQNPGEINYGFCDCGNGYTPLHIAAENGQLSIIINN